MELKRCACFNIPIGCWDVSKVKDVSFMFYDCAALISPWISQQILKIMSHVS
ncbi:BspA family leucine-rich repeat surface protein [Campylobacter magnus]|uniref:BspA family leucine-rich repeat surface protein n=1 Tax=Campylobacter magnus TaxID=3026462 RepID=UPI0034A06367